MITIAVCDDDMQMLQNLCENINLYMEQHHLDYTLHKFISGEQLLASTQRFDLILLDIKMNGINGMETARALRKIDKKGHLIFITALQEYVFDAFDVGAANYLLKPLNLQKLHQTLDKIIDCLITTDQAVLSYSYAQSYQKIRFTDILYAEVFNHTVILHTIHGTEKYSEKIETLAQKLDVDFYRCHRSYILNFKYLQGYREGFALLSNGQSIPIAKRRRQAFFQALLQYQRKAVR